MASENPIISKYQSEYKKLGKTLTKLLTDIHFETISEYIVECYNFVGSYDPTIKTDTKLIDIMISDTKKKITKFYKEKLKEVDSKRTRISVKKLQVGNSETKKLEEMNSNIQFLNRDTFLDNVKQTTKITDKCFKELQNHIKQYTKTTSNFAKSESRRQNIESGKQLAGIASNAVFGAELTALGAGAIFAIKNHKELYKNFKKKTLKEKILAGGSALMKGVAAQTNSPAALMAAGRLSDNEKNIKTQRDAVKQKNRDLKRQLIASKRKEQEKKKEQTKLPTYQSQLDSIKAAGGWPAHFTVAEKDPEFVNGKLIKRRTSFIADANTTQVLPTKTGGRTSLNNKLLPRIKAAGGFGSGGSFESMTSPIVAEISKSSVILKGILEEQKQSRMIQEETQRDSELSKKPNKTGTSKGGSEKEKLTAAVAEKGLIGGVMDTVKNRLTEKMVDKLTSGPGMMKNLAKGGLVAGGAAAGGYGGYKAGDWAAEKMGFEEGGTAEKITKGVGAVGGAALVGLVTSKVLSKIPFFNKLAPKEGTHVYITNTKDISSGGGMTDLLPSKGGKISKLLGKIPGIGKFLGGGATVAAEAAGGATKAVGAGSKLLGGGAKLLGGLSKFAGPIGLAITAGMAAKDAYSGYKNADQITGKKPGEKSSTLEKVGAGAAGALSGITFGLVKPETMYKGLSKAVTLTPFGLAYKGIKKANEIIIKKDLSPETKKQLEIDKANIKNSESQTEKADENKTLMEKMTSIWSDPNKSFLGKLGGSMSSVGSSVGSTFQGVKERITGGGGSNYDISKLSGGIGSVAAMFESGKGGAGTISSGKGDHGGKSYGTHQMTAKTLPGFLKSSGYDKQFGGAKPGSAEFDSKWKELASSDPNFGKAQHDFITKTHASPVLGRLEKAGWDVKNRAIQEMAYSTGVQYGPGSNIMQEAMKAAGKDPKSTPVNEIIDIVQDYKANTVGSKFKSSSTGVQAGVAKRHSGAERAALKKVAAAGGSAQQSTSPTTTTSPAAAPIKKKKSKSSESSGGAQKASQVKTELVAQNVKGGSKAKTTSSSPLNINKNFQDMYNGYKAEGYTHSEIIYKMRSELGSNKFFETLGIDKAKVATPELQKQYVNSVEYTYLMKKVQLSPATSVVATKSPLSSVPSTSTESSTLSLNGVKSSPEPISYASKVPVPENKGVDSIVQNSQAKASESETTKLKQKAVSVEAKQMGSIAESTGKAINNITNISSGSTAPSPIINITTGDTVSFASRLSRMY